MRDKADDDVFYATDWCSDSVLEAATTALAVGLEVPLRAVAATQLK